MLMIVFLFCLLFIVIFFLCFLMVVYVIDSFNFWFWFLGLVVKKGLKICLCNWGGMFFLLLSIFIVMVFFCFKRFILMKFFFLMVCVVFSIIFINVCFIILGFLVIWRCFVLYCNLYWGLLYCVDMSLMSCFSSFFNLMICIFFLLFKENCLRFFIIFFICVKLFWDLMSNLWMLFLSKV